MNAEDREIEMRDLEDDEDVNQADSLNIELDTKDAAPQGAGLKTNAIITE